MINFEQYLLERKGSSAGQQTKRKVNIEQLKQMIANKDSNIADVDVSEIKDMSYLFYKTDFGGSWTADLSGWDTSNVEYMSWMFKNCKELTKVSLPHTEKVENMAGMFYGCKELTKVELPRIEKVKSMIGMFEGCTSLKEVSLLHTQNVTNMNYMFYGCTNLTKVELSNNGKVEDMGHMFHGCKMLAQNFFDWNIKGKKTFGMFQDCTKMENAYKNKNNLYPEGYEQ